VHLFVSIFLSFGLFFFIIFDVDCDKDDGLVMAGLAEDWE
jgi:hypothetical protein